MLTDALLVLRKDLKIEARSRVVLAQIAPFAAIVLVLFAFALDNLVIRDKNRSSDLSSIASSAVTAGLFWLGALFSCLLAIGRSFSIETSDNSRDGLRLSSLDPAGIFIGKAAAVFVQLCAIEVVLIAGAELFFRTEVGRPWIFILIAFISNLGLCATGTAYGALASGIHSRDSLLPILYFPIVAPMLLGSVKATAGAFTGDMSEMWPWLRLLTTFAVVYCVMGVLLFGQLLEDS